MAGSSEPLKELYVALTAKDQGQKQAIKDATADVAKAQQKMNLPLRPPTRIAPIAEEKGVGGIALAGEAEGAAAALGPVGVALGAVAVGAGLAYSALNKFSSEVIRLSAIANPVAVERFNLALQDAQGVIGLRMLPILERFTQIVRTFGDFLATILPSSREIESVLKEMDPGLQELRQALADIAPIIRVELVGALRLMVPLLKEWAWQMKLMSQFSPLGIAARFLGGEGNQLETSRGASARPAQFVGLEELSKQTAISAYSQGYEDPAARTANNTDQIAKKLTELFLWLQTAAEAAGAAGGAVNDILNPARHGAMFADWLRGR